MTLARLGRQLGDAGASTLDDITRGEYRAVFNYQGRRIGIQTFGDTENVVNAGLNHFLDNSCQIIAIASKRYGQTIARLDAFANVNNFRIIWVAPYEVRDDSISTNTIKEYCASHLLLMIDDVISNRL
ncbi:hypothetical protein [Aridibaculum aurantiacum]|uniref:hypothetical protein n=1 Tax=Aridibaculum aurantiacum TaxID=2810307 RepID=UPI001A95D145|nr:hypothetical protein [Aridibaculum aurantiacum]